MLTPPLCVLSAAPLSLPLLPVSIHPSVTMLSSLLDSTADSASSSRSARPERELTRLSDADTRPASQADSFNDALLGDEESMDSAPSCATVPPPRYSSLSSATLTLAISAAGAGMLSFPYAGPCSLRFRSADAQ